MAGNTGKMTAEMVQQRGPRFRLVGSPSGFVVEREGQTSIGKTARAMAYAHRHGISVYARSYSVRYLLNVAKGMRHV